MTYPDPHELSPADPLLLPRQRAIDTTAKTLGAIKRLARTRAIGLAGTRAISSVRIGGRTLIVKESLDANVAGLISAALDA